MSRRRESTLTIETPEGVVFSFELATPVTRALAWAVDMVAISAHQLPARQASRLRRQTQSGLVHGRRHRPLLCDLDRLRNRAGVALARPDHR